MAQYHLTKYEKCRVIGERAKLLSMNSTPMIDVSKLKNPTPIEIAKEELRQNKLPMIITRTFPDGEKQNINLYIKE